VSSELLYELRQLRQEFAHLAAVHSPWIGMDEMQKRYDCTGKTLLAMERRKEIPEGDFVKSDIPAYSRMARYSASVGAARLCFAGNEAFKQRF